MNFQNGGETLSGSSAITVKTKQKARLHKVGRGLRVIDVVIVCNGILHRPWKGVTIYESDLEFNLLEQTKCGKVGFLFKNTEVFDSYKRCEACEGTN